MPIPGHLAMTGDGLIGVSVYLRGFDAALAQVADVLPQELGRSQATTLGLLGELTDLVTREKERNLHYFGRAGFTASCGRTSPEG